jgi:hypothetical protein
VWAGIRRLMLTNACYSVLTARMHEEQAMPYALQQHPDRGAPRKLVHGKVELRQGAQQWVAILQDLSLSGLKIQDHAKRPPGEHIWIDLPQHAEVEATVVWSDALWTGLKLKKPLTKGQFGNIALSAGIPVPPLVEASIADHLAIGRELEWQLKILYGLSGVGITCLALMEALTF